MKDELKNIKKEKNQLNKNINILKNDLIKANKTNNELDMINKDLKNRKNGKKKKWFLFSKHLYFEKLIINKK